MQELMIIGHNRLVPLPPDIDRNIAAFTELVSVMVHVISRFDLIAHDERSTIGFWGDGNVGFIGSLLCRACFPSSRVVVFGHSSEKLADFTFADEAYVTSDVPEGLVVSHAFECAGGNGAASAIDQIIDHIQPEGTIALCGVSEDKVAINTRMVLEKGLRLIGSSRSGRSDFVRALDLYEQHPSLLLYLKRIVGQVFTVNELSDVAEAFEADILKRLGKTVMRWNI